MKTLAIIVPCFNEEEVFPIFIEKISSVIKKLYERFDIKTDLIFVDDGSTDDTLFLIKNCKTAKTKLPYMDVEHISFTRNFGKEAALYAGFAEADADYTAIMDIDMEDPPELLIDMVEKILRGDCDCVAARRKYTGKNNTHNALLRKIYYFLFEKTTKLKLKDGTRNFRVMSRRMIDNVLGFEEKKRFSNGIFSWLGYKTEWVEYDYVPRTKGYAKWNLNALFKYAKDSIVSFSDCLLYIPFILAILSLIFTITGLIYLIINSPTPLLVLTIILSLGFTGTFLCIGVCGLYVAKIKEETSGRKLYIVNEESKKEF